MKKGYLTLAISLLLLVASATEADLGSASREALLKELSNRKLAGMVVSSLAEAHEGTSQGEFWLAYSQLEVKQWPIYEEQAKLHELRPGGLLLSLKAHASILFARLFPETFIDMLAKATRGYASELAAFEPPAAQQAFWEYVIAQELAQAEAFQHASKQDYPGARAVLVGFLESSTSPTNLDR